MAYQARSPYRLTLALAMALTGGVAAVPLSLWLGLGGTISGLFAGNVEAKTPVELALDADASKAGGSDE